MSAHPQHRPGALFTSAAEDYDRFRPGIPAEAVSLLADAVRNLDRPVLLDLGTGTGTGTGQAPAALLPAVPRIAHVDLADRDEDTLRQAAAALEPLLGGRPLGRHAVAAEAFTPPYYDYRADLVTSARSFHWMDRSAVLAMADRVTSPGAAVAITGDGSLWTNQAQWTAALKQLIHSYLGEGRRAGTVGVYAGPGRRYEDDLAESPFRQVTEHTFPVRRVWAPPQVVGYLRSTSFARPALFGDRHARFEAEARQFLDRHGEHSGLVEDAVFTVLLARRPGGGS